MSNRQSSSQFSCEVLCKKHDRANFSCGNNALDSYLRAQANQDGKKGVAVTFVISNDGSAIAGFYTLSQYAVEIENFPPEITKRLPSYPRVPVTLIGRLVVDKRFQKKGLGELLLMNALERSLTISKQVASVGVIVDPKPNREGFYKKYGFIELPGHKDRLFLPMKTISELMSQ